MPICPPCAQAADKDARNTRVLRDRQPTGHDPATCRDHGLTPNGCGCQHQPARTTTEGQSR